MLTETEKDSAIDTFVQLIRFPTVSDIGPTNGSYDACTAWLLSELQAIGLEAFILPESRPHKPIVVGTWTGSSPHLPCIVLNSHYDVVPASDEHWTVPPFEGLRDNKRIYGRGAQDMKCVCAQYLVALGKLKKLDFSPVRTIHVTFVPDEEIGGIEGMNVLTESAWFKAQTVALALDEGLANMGDDFSVFYGERIPWWIHVTASGNTGHGSRFVDGSAVQQVVEVCNRALHYRQEQQDLLHGKGHHAGCSHAVAKKKSRTLGDVTSLNVTMLRAGVQAAGKDVINVIPPTAEAGFDIRVSPHVEPMEIAAMLDTWCHEVNTVTPGLQPGQGVKWEFYHEPLKKHAVTSTSSETNPWWRVFSSTMLSEFSIQVVPEVFPAATDSRFLRAIGINALGFSPIRRSPILLHEHNEYIDEDVFLEGCEIYLKLVPALALQGELVGGETCPAEPTGGQ